ncbi:hypothetical protein GALMADRAFT_153633 [Galerina marginata CBS 339.88]|uniref:Aminoglycoside phosphotransferase domain-containing protein n=1 Tax=Galerina marginata (strain CBS 339.88) TaxID=685588 RepID=A0A067TJ13_GALM3|nr:hypothetical protein GALMADRAFT_153633 [Galerina marginata CBS 339.88]
MTSTVQSIRVAICGASGSGKTKLMEQLDGYTFIRPRDNKSFRLTVQETDSESIIFPDYKFALFTFTLQNDPDLEIDQKWRAIKASIWERYPLHFSKICLVGTKLDLVTLREHACVRSLRAAIAFWVKVKYISTSSITKIGLDDVARLIADQVYPLPVQAETFNRGLLERLGNKLLDVLASLFALPVPKNINQDTPDPLVLADDDAVEPLWTSPEAMAFNKHIRQMNNTGFSTSSAFKISPTLLAKSRKPVEWANTVFARSQFNIPIPQPRYHHLKHWFVQDFIQGKTLQECWDTLGFFMRFRIACTLRGYISQMRRLTRTLPGSVDGGAIIGFNFAFMYNGPYSSSRRLHQWFEEAAYQGWRRLFEDDIAAVDDGRMEATVPLPMEPLFPNFDENLMFTHGDISPGNLILFDDNVLWMIDWCDSGFYPPWVEPLTLYRYEKLPQSSTLVVRRSTPSPVSFLGLFCS